MVNEKASSSAFFSGKEDYKTIPIGLLLLPDFILRLRLGELRGINVYFLLKLSLKLNTGFRTSATSSQCL